MQPVARELLVVGGLRLRDLVFVMREHQVDSTGVDVESFAEVALAHRRALDVPARPPAPERRIPGPAQLLVLRVRVLPEREVAHRLLVIFVRRHALAGLQSFPVEVRQRPVRGKARDPEVHVAVRDVRVLVLDELADHLDHLGNVLGRARVVRGWLGAKRAHVLEESGDVRFDVLADRDPGVHRLVEDAVVDVGEVHHVGHLVAADLKMAAGEVIDEKSPKVPDVRVVPDCRPARVHAGMAWFEGLEHVLRARQRVVKLQRHVSSMSAMAWAAMPSLRPSAPRPSGEVALTLTTATPSFNEVAMLSRIWCRWGCSRGSSATTVLSTLTIR